MGILGVFIALSCGVTLFFCSSLNICETDSHLTVACCSARSHNLAASSSTRPLKGSNLVKASRLKRIRRSLQYSLGPRCHVCRP